MTPSPSSYVTITCKELGESIRTLLGEDVPRIVGGYGGWDTIDRPRKRGAVEYAGPGPLQLQLEIVLDAWGWDVLKDNVNTDLLALESMSKPSGANKPPPTVTVTGKAIPQDKSMPWVIDNITWGTTILGTEGQVLRQTAQLDLLQADVAEHMRELSPTKARAPVRNPHKPYHWKKGDTWARVAKKLMPGVPYAARKIQKFNGFRPGMTMKVGQLVRVPPDAK